MSNHGCFAIKNTKLCFLITEEVDVFKKEKKKFVLCEEATFTVYIS